MKKIIFISLLLCFKLFLYTSCSRSGGTTRQPGQASATISSDELRKILKSQERTDGEIDLLLKMPQQLANVDINNLYIIFSGCISYGHYGRMGGHYFLIGHDDGQTGQNCGLFAIIRILFVLGQNGVVDEDLWYKYTVQQLRDILVDQVVTGGVHVEEYYRDQGMPLEAPEIKALMQHLGIPVQYTRIVKKGEYWVDEAESSIEQSTTTIEFINDLEKVQNSTLTIGYVEDENRKGKYNPVSKGGKKIFDQNDIDKKIQAFKDNSNKLLSYMIEQRKSAIETLQKAQRAIKTGDFSYLNDLDAALQASLS